MYGRLIEPPAGNEVIEMDDDIAKRALEDEIHFCAAHPQRDTELRCNRCQRYMCVDCAVRTPVGYTCRQCVRGHEDRFFEGTAVDYGLVAATCAVGGALTPLVMLLIGGFLILGFIVAPAIGGTAGQIALQLTGRRRGRYSGYVAAGAVVGGGLASALLLLGGLGLFTLLFLALAASGAYARFRVSI
ncbi:MAG: B-box zinc finger protein [Chloroflexi bacterium]|nr:B-box zinc finger protein [Chloroflexota bacterium]